MAKAGTRVRIDPERIRRAWERLSQRGLLLPPPTMAFFRLELLSPQDADAALPGTGARTGAPSLVLAFAPDERMCNPAGIVQGGVIAGVLDEAIGVLTAALVEGRPFTTAHLALDYFAPVPPGRRYLACASLVREGRRRMVVDAELLDPGRPDRPLARASAQQLFLDLVASGGGPRSTREEASSAKE